MYRNGRFEEQKGYYIYYEKNPEMLAYMERENNRRVHIVEQEDDRVVRNIRGIMEEKEQLREQNRKRQKRESRMGYGLGSMVALIALVIGVATFRNQNALNQVKRQVEHLQQMALGEQKKQKTVVETMGSGLVKETATPAAASAAASAEKAAPGKVQRGVQSAE